MAEVQGSEHARDDQGAGDRADPRRDPRAGTQWGERAEDGVRLVPGQRQVADVALTAGSADLWATRRRGM